MIVKMLQLDLSLLKRRVERKHESNKHLCYGCYDTATTASSLKVHIKKT